jgi:hypothetical protein
MSTETEMWWSRKFRVLHALPSNAWLAAVSSATAILAVSVTLFAGKMESHPWILGLAVTVIAFSVCVLAFTIVVMCLKTWLEFKRLTFDPAIATPLLTRFEAINREKAAQKCIESIERGGWGGIPEPECVDTVLDFFEDVGLQLVTNQISDELAHHHFYTWIRMYYSATAPYIHEQRQVHGITTWQYLKPLFDRTFLIEKRTDSSARKEPLAEEMIKFFRAE